MNETIEILAGEHALDAGATIHFDPEWLDRTAADDLFRELRTGIGWEQGKITMFGRDLLEPRLTAWFGDADYTYSGRTVRASPWPSSLARLRARLEGDVGRPFNAVLLNLYRNGIDSMGMHADDEPELGPNPVIGSVSLGAARRFVLSPKKKSARGSRTYAIRLGHGSLLVMGGSCQHVYRHGLPKQSSVDGERINLTFRYVHVR